MLLPLKQGLKHECSPKGHRAPLVVVMLLPLKQGLKQH